MKNKKRILILSGSILVIAMIAVGLYFLLTKKDSDSGISENYDSGRHKGCYDEFNKS